MTTYQPSNLITPPREEEEVYPYRRVWQSIILEFGILTVITIAIFVVFGIIGVKLSRTAELVTNIGLALIPTLLWLLSSRLRESYVIAPRRRLLSVFIVTGLICNAIGIPIINQLIQPQAWLADADLMTRIIGYTTTIAIIQEFLKYIVLRYLVWPDFYRNRTDAIAYGASAAMGYATMLSLIYVLQEQVTPHYAMIKIYTYCITNLIGSTILSYGLSESALRRASPAIMPISLFLSALTVGLLIPISASIGAAPLGRTISSTRLFLTIGFEIAALVGLMSLLGFVFNVATQRDKTHVQEL